MVAFTNRCFACLSSTPNAGRVSTASRAHRRSFRFAFYLNHTPTLQYFKHLNRQIQAPGTTPATVELPALADVSINWVSSLSGITPKAAIVRNAVKRSQFPAVVFRMEFNTADFGGPNVEASPYPSIEAVCSLAPTPN